MKKLVILALSLILLVSCGAKQPLPPETTPDTSKDTVRQTGKGLNTNVAEYEDGTNATITGGRDPALSFEDVQKLYPDKTVLVWVLPDFYRTELEVNTEVNEYLDSLGKDYAVYFKLLPYTSAEGDYIDIVKANIAEGEAVDILYSAELSENSSASFSYHSYITEGLFEPLNGYFENTDVGKKLYEQMPANYWQLLSVDGKIYAADGSSGNYSYPSGYCVNKKLAEKYGFDIYKPIAEQLDVLEKVGKGEQDCDIVFFPMKMGNSAFYPEVFEGLKGIVYDCDTDSLIRLTEDKAFLDRLSEINTLVKAGYVNSSNEVRAKSFFISYGAADALSAGNIGTEAVRYHSSDEPIEVLNVYNTDKTSFKVPNTATGVCSYSANKDMAFDLLATVMTDGYLNDLLAGGENGQFAVVFSDKFKNEAVSSVIDDNLPENHNQMYLSAVDKAELPPFIGFCFDTSPVSEQYKKVKDFIMNYDFAQNKEMEVILDEVNKDLDEAGIDEVLSEVNRQYKEWRTKQ